MKFDAIVGNPPYQMMDGGAQASAVPMYNLFSENIQSLGRINCLIQPSRWMTGGKGLDEYRDKMIHDRHIKVLLDYVNSREVFSKVDIKGGVCVYLRDNEYEGTCECHRYSADNDVNVSQRYLCEDGDNIFIREPMLISIKNKVISRTNKMMSSIITARNAYGLRADAMRDAAKYGLPEFKDESCKDGYEILGLIGGRRGWKYLPSNYPIPKIHNALMKYKVFLAEAYGNGSIGEAPSSPVVAVPRQLCTETYLQMGCFDTIEEAKALEKYIKTKFFRTLVSVKKQTQHTTQKVYIYVPLEDFTNGSDINWNVSIHEIDLQLYKKYGLEDAEIAFIEEKVKEMI